MADKQYPVAFTLEAIEHINTLATSLDSRLYLFADYEPKKIEIDSTNRLLFLTNVINAYALMYDCGKLLQMYMLGKWKDAARPSILTKLTQKHLKMYSNLFDLIGSIRNSSFHNMCCKYYNNDSHLIRYHDFLKQTIGSEKEWHQYSDEDWNVTNTKFVDLCKAVEMEFQSYLCELIDIASQHTGTKVEIVDYWLESIQKWYAKENSHLLEHTLCSFYAPRRYPHRIQAHEAKKALGTSWKQKKKLSGMSINDAAMDYYTESVQRIPALLKNKNLCPTPALPMQFYYVLISDVRYFA